ncbi:BLUF domain-containing protein [Croceicoccus ponticola]|uniref:BLUF domain-containing protein n=1 Tax=Croceicoccus ponticola TaxID=2217664 RepID=A0A437H1R0_9SPHN|nr:BLUF domain-containing protein [Croceicoccus ponticola]RVQ69587.1 BLUF domain-containing protein [Croceicoccus ponticola]
MISLVCVSQPTCWTRSRKETLDDIQAVSQARNSALNVTGVLIATTTHFAHVLEGPKDAVESVLTSIMSDPRHCRVNVVRRTPIFRRRFPVWRLARMDRGRFASFALAGTLKRLHTAPDRETLHHFDQLTDALARSYHTTLT